MRSLFLARAFSLRRLYRRAFRGGLPRDAQSVSGACFLFAPFVSQSVSRWASARCAIRFCFALWGTLPKQRYVKAPPAERKRTAVRRVPAVRLPEGRF
jgi:hypothetical protein